MPKGKVPSATHGDKTPVTRFGCVVSPSDVSRRDGSALMLGCERSRQPFNGKLQIIGLP